MKIAFELNCVIGRELDREFNSIISFIKILKRAGHVIILWSESELDEIQIFVKENKLTGYIDIVASKSSIREENIPDIAFDCEEDVISRLVTINI